MKNYIIFGIVAVVVIVGAAMYKAGQPSTTIQNNESGPTVPSESVSAQPEPAISGTVVTNPKPITMKDGLIIEDTKIGDGMEAKKGDLVTVHYVGTLTNGTKFDASRDHGNDGFTFPLGQGMVIKGWEEGVAGMKVGGVRKLTIPPELGYGAKGAGGVIPGNATLLFEVELLKVRES